MSCNLTNVTYEGHKTTYRKSTIDTFSIQSLSSSDVICFLSIKEGTVIITDRGGCGERRNTTLSNTVARQSYN